MAQQVDLGGWHHAFAMKYKDVNGQIASKNAGSPGYSPVNTSGKTGGSSPEPINVSGDPSPWQLVQGGKEEAVKIGVEIDNAVASIGSVTFTGKISVIISGELSVSGNSISIVRPQLPPGVSPYGIDLSGLMGPSSNPAPDNTQAIFIKKILEQWLDTLWPLFGTEITTIDPAIELPDGWDWFKPTSSRAIVNEQGAVADDFQFIVVSMTGGASAPTGGVAVTGNFIPETSRIGIAIAPEIFLQNAILPQMGATFLQTPPEKFSVNGNVLSAGAPIVVESFKSGDDQPPVQATFANVQFRVDAEYLILSTHVSFPYTDASEGHMVEVDFDFTLKFGFELTRETYITKDNQTITDFPMIKPLAKEDPGVDITNLTFQATDGWNLAQIIVPIAGAVVVCIAGSGVAYYKFKMQPAEEGEQAIELEDPQSGTLAPADPQQQAATTDQAEALATAAESGDKTTEKNWGCLPESTMKTILASIGSALFGLGTGALIPLIVYIEGKLGVNRVNGTFDDAISKVLAVFPLPDRFGESFKVSAANLNNCLLIGADPVQ